MPEQQAEVVGLDETLAALGRLPTVAEASLAKRTGDLAGVLVAAVQAAGRGSDAQSAMVAATVTTTRGRMPQLTAGGAVPVGRHGTPAHKVFFGAEFGSGRLPQFRAYNDEGYWMTPTVDAETAEDAKVWDQVLDDVDEDFGRDDVGGRVG